MSKRKGFYEEEFQGHLDFAGYGYFREFRFEESRMWRADFNLYHHRVLVEIDGVVYKGYGRHQNAVGYQGDCEKLNRAVELGYRVLRFTPKMVLGKAVRGKSRIPMDKAIRVVDRVCFGERAKSFDTTREGYAAEAMLDLSMGRAGAWKNV